MQQLLIGNDVPGSTVTLQVAKGGIKVDPTLFAIMQIQDAVFYTGGKACDVLLRSLHFKWRDECHA